MKILNLSLLLMVSFQLTMAQPDSAAQKFAQTITEQHLFAHLSYLADDLLEGRETGERGQQMAAHYIRTQFMRMGLPGATQEKDPYFQTYLLGRTNIESIDVSVGNKNYTYREDFFQSGSNVPDKMEGELVFVGYGITEPDYNNLEGLDVKDKIALAIAGGPTPPEGDISLFNLYRQWRARGDAFEAAGAKGFMMILPDSIFQTFSRFVRRRSMSVTTENPSAFPTLLLSESMGNDILKTGKAKLERLREELNQSAKPRDITFKKAKVSLTSDVEREIKHAENVMGYLEGTDKKDELIVLTAHYDHIGINNKGEINNGADDDGSGTSAIIEIAEAFAMAAQAGYRPRRSILFMTVSGEEKGLLGSAFYTENPIFPLENTVANLNIDMIGRIDPKYEKLPDSTNYVYIIGSDRLSSELHEISEGANQTYTNMVLDYRYNADNDPQRFYYRSDHYNFAKNDIPVVFYFSGTHEDYHKPTDDVDKIYFGTMTKVARLVYYTAWDLANREGRIMVDKKESEGDQK
ncbi:MAG: M28 family peptidase [Bacteroidetes bacterium]|nr:M28 family peptidase [Bacteroidota bacterium]